MRVPVVAVLLCLAPALAAPQSLGDAARRQARKRTTEAPAARVYTGEDLRPETDVPGPSRGRNRAGHGEAETAATDAAPPPPAPATEDAVRAQLDREAAERKQRERYWRQRAGAAHARLASAQREHDTVCGPRRPRPHRGLTQEGTRQGPGRTERAAAGEGRLRSPGGDGPPRERPARLAARLSRSGRTLARQLAIDVAAAWPSGSPGVSWLQQYGSPTIW